MDMRFVIWNVGRFSSAGLLETVTSEIAKCKSDLEAVQKVRWDEGGSQPADDYTFSTEMGMLTITWGQAFHT
jgi:hypothetical protein